MGCGGSKAEDEKAAAQPGIKTRRLSGIKVPPLEARVKCWHPLHPEPYTIEAKDINAFGSQKCVIAWNGTHDFAVKCQRGEFLIGRRTVIGAFNRGQNEELRQILELKVYVRSAAQETAPPPPDHRHKGHALSAGVDAWQGMLDEAIRMLDDLDGVDKKVKTALTQCLKKEEVTVTKEEVPKARRISCAEQTEEEAAQSKILAEEANKAAEDGEAKAEE